MIKNKIHFIPGKTNNKIYIAISVANIDRKPVNIKLHKEEKEKYINLIDITTKI